MMVSLFSPFDPLINNSAVNWLSTIVCLALLSISIMTHSSTSVLVNSYSRQMWTSVALTLHHMGMVVSLSISTMTIIAMWNLFGLVPYIFTPSSHLALTVSLAVPMYLMISISNWALNTKDTLAHMVPPSTPQYLIMFMVLVESISGFLRPCTLALRLAANMIAGHLLLSIIGSTIALFSSYGVYIVLAQSLLSLLELLVSLIQAWVFSMLMSLYYTS